MLRFPAVYVMAGKRGGALPAPGWERFWAKVDRQGPEDCWPWIGALNDSGYGAIWDGTGLVYAHRLSWLIHGGSIPDKLQVDHLCRNRACVNPAHLDIVTHKDNVYRGWAARVEDWVPPPERPPHVYRHSEWTRAFLLRLRRERAAKKRGEVAPMGLRARGVPLVEQTDGRAEIDRITRKRPYPHEADRGE